jgi:predicted dehydrogenase
VVTVLPGGLRAGPFVPSAPPAALDWVFWQGQTPATGYVKERAHMTFRYWLEYSGGTMTDWGAHHNDIALWSLGMERSGPRWIDGKSLAQPIPGGYTAPSAYLVEYTYANGVRHICRSTPGNNISGGAGEKPGPEHGVTFHGSEGWIFVTRGKLQASKPELLQEPLPPRAIRLYPSSNHMGDFFESVRTRYQPACDAEIGHRSASVCHLGVLSMRLGRRLQWNPTREAFIDDPEANALLAREMRAPYNYDMIA